MRLKDLLFGSTVKEATEAATGLSDSVFTGLDELFTSDEERAMWAAKKLEIQNKIMELVNNNIQALNLINANDVRLLNSGWRPFIGWVLGVSIACYFIPRFVLASIMWVKHSWAADAIVAYPVDDAGLWQLATMMLGSAVIRTYEKQNNTAKH